MPATLPLAPIEADFESKIQSTIAQRDKISSVVAKIQPTLRNVFLVGAGGSIIASYPAYYALYRNAPFAVHQVQSDEFNTGHPATLGEGSLVILASHTGKTKETVAAAQNATKAGATVISVTEEGTPLAEASEYALFGESDLMEAMIAYEILRQSGVELDYDAIDAAFDAMPKALLSAQEESEQTTQQIADALKDEPITYVLGSGPSYAWAYGLAMCYLQEMQWKHAAAFNSGEFFQGAFEMLDENLAVILLLGEDESRPMGERAKSFLERFGGKNHYLDTKDLSLGGVSDEIRPHVSPFALRVVVGRLAKHYEAARGHNLDQRHYMFKVEY